MKGSGSERIEDPSGDDNPYRAPHIPGDSFDEIGVHEESVVERGPMPPSVILASVCTGGLLALAGIYLLGAAMTLVLAPKAVNTTGVLPTAMGSFVLSALIFLGMIMGHRLAWQWGRVLTILGSILLGLAVVGSVFVPDRNQVRPNLATLITAIAFSIWVLLMITIFVCLGRTSAKRYFRLVCPTCRKTTNKAADFLFNRASCKACGRIW